MSRAKKKPTSFFKRFQYWVWPNKLHFAIFIAVLLLIGGLAFALTRQDKELTTTQTSYVDDDVPQDVEESHPETIDQPEDTPQPTTSPAPPVPFAVTRVFFREYPSTPAGAEEGVCYEGQEIKFPITAEVTNTGAGTAEYHWEMGDNMKGDIKKFETKTIQFNKSGVTKISDELTYVVYDTSSYTGLPGPAYQVRPHMNLVFTKPNIMYANINNPVYTNNNFIWGNYIQLCD